ncbi:MAG: sigma-70 family RNA polymerase sigma factor [Gammaproteobacteria bacterium]|nr:sigma-70 family RNA polymerase sigma factor [Gammaproteobacteria bacterium]
MNTLHVNRVSESDNFWSNQERIEEIQKDMLRFTLLQLRDKSLAEDLVQEAFMAAYENKEKFNGEAQFKTWIFTILKNKMIDFFRHNKRRTHINVEIETEDKLLGSCFKQNDHWNQESQPNDWGDPDKILDNKQFWIILDICMKDMKDNLAQVFSMREILGLETAKICEILEIKENNCWILLHRARSRLRICLENRWLTS